MDILSFAVSEGHGLDLGLDLTTGTGWCFGGPNISEEIGGWRLQTKVIEVPAGGALTERFDPKAVQALVAVGADGWRVDLKRLLDERGWARWDTAGQGWKVWPLPALRRLGLAGVRLRPAGAGDIAGR